MRVTCPYPPTITKQNSSQQPQQYCPTTTTILSIITFRSFPSLMEAAERNRLRSCSRIKASVSEEVTSMEWEDVEMSAQEVDLIYRMHRLVGERWDLIAGRIPGRRAEEIERFWIMRHREGSAGIADDDMKRRRKKSNS